jgi:methionine aminopeptidase
VTIDQQEDLDALVRAGRVVAEARRAMVAAVAPGTTTGSSSIQWSSRKTDRSF